MLSELSYHKILYPDIGFPIISIGLYGLTVFTADGLAARCPLLLSDWHYLLASDILLPRTNGLTYLPYLSATNIGVVGIRGSSNSSSDLF